jgi:hypothetical protein
MSKAGPGLAPNCESQSGKVSPTGAKKIFSAGGVKGSQPKAPILKPGQSSKMTGK